MQQPPVTEFASFESRNRRRGGGWVSEWELEKRGLDSNLFTWGWTRPPTIARGGGREVVCKGGLEGCLRVPNALRAG